MNQLLNDYGLFILVILFIVFSLYYRNFVNIGIFLILFVGLRNMMNEEKALLYAYCISIFYGIVKNFHLLENFTSNNNNENTLLPGGKLNIKALFNAHDNNENIVKMALNKNMLNSESESDLEQPGSENNTNVNDTNVNNTVEEEIYGGVPTSQSSIMKMSKSEKKKKMKKLKAPEMDEIISEDLINKFIKRLKHEDNLLITKEKMNLYKISPTINKLSKNKIEKIKKNMINDDRFAKKPIVITKDFFILDGHHRWYAKKSLIEHNSNGYNVGDLYNENVQVVIIDYNIRKCVQKLQEYKIKYNKDYLEKSITDINNISNGKKYLDEIKDTIKNLESNYSSFANVELV